MIEIKAYQTPNYFNFTKQKIHSYLYLKEK